MSAALVGGAGLLVLVLAATAALLADLWRQRPAGRRLGSRTDHRVAVATALAVVLTLVGVAATVLRLAALAT